MEKERMGDSSKMIITVMKEYLTTRLLSRQKYVKSSTGRLYLKFNLKQKWKTT
jgi:p-aminobenzoyl-glutamate transporter AbgT